MTASSTVQQKKEREHKPTRKAQMKFEDLRSNEMMENQVSE